MITTFEYTDVQALENWWIDKSRMNFLAYRRFMRSDKLLYNWFIIDLCQRLQQFFIDLKAGLRPVLLIQSPPQHGKSWSMTDFIAWVSGMMPELRIIYASFSDLLGIRCNSQLQRFFDSEKHQKIFPDHRINIMNSVTISGKPRRNSKQIEYVDGQGIPTDGYFRNTTVNGAVVGETLDLGVIDDPVKGRDEANSIAITQKIWEWFTDDFGTRLSDKAGLIVTMTRWTTHDVIGRMLKIKDSFGKNFTHVNYQAVATKDEEHRKTGDPLFPELKSKEFLESRKSLLIDKSWDSLYQGAPVLGGGNIFKDEWWQWYTVLPPLKYKFITADTAQKKNKRNDFTVFQCWGMTFTNQIVLIDKIRERMESPTLRKEAEIFYNKHNISRKKADDPILRGMYIEDKSSGTGLIQELKKKRLKIYEVPRSKDKVFRGEDAAPFIKAGHVVLSTKVPGIGNLTKEAREHPDGEFDDDIDTLLTAVEVSFIIADAAGSSLEAAMRAA